jgi:phosphotriesterase-related protein
MKNNFLQNHRAIGRRNFLKLAGAGSAVVFLPASLVWAGQGSGTLPEKPIPTVTGGILPSQMGITSVHEHIPLNFEPEQRARSMAFAVSELKKAKENGLQTIIEVSPTRDVAGLREVSLATGVNVVCCTGFYVLTNQQQSITVEECENHMVSEIEEGIQGTSIRPGVIKVAAKGLPITPAERNVFIAAAHIQQRYKLPICTHAVRGCAEQQQILEEAGADLNHVYFSHVEATFGWSGRKVEQEIDYLENVVKKGSTLSFNNFGNWYHTKPEDLALIIRELTKRGYDDRMVATMDLTWSFENGDLKILWGDTNKDGNDRTYSYLLRKAVPWIRKNGISRKSVNKFIHDNPQRLFAI